MKLSPVLLAAVSADQEFCLLTERGFRAIFDLHLVLFKFRKRALLAHHLILISRIHGLFNVEVTKIVPHLLFNKSMAGIGSMLKEGCLAVGFWF